MTYARGANPQYVVEQPKQMYTTATAKPMPHLAPPSPATLAPILQMQARAEAKGPRVVQVRTNYAHEAVGGPTWGDPTTGEVIDQQASASKPYDQYERPNSSSKEKAMVKAAVVTATNAAKSSQEQGTAQAAMPKATQDESTARSVPDDRLPGKLL